MQPSSAILIGSTLIASMLLTTIGGISSATAATTIPTRYEAGHFFAVPETRSGQLLKLLIDTGAGGVTYAITPAAARRLGLGKTNCTGLPDVVQLPDFKPGLALPRPSGSCHGVFVYDHEGAPRDGLLGGNYLASRIWTFDYPGQRISDESLDWKPVVDMHAAALGFQRDEAGAIATGYPRIPIVVDGQPLDMLLDTGATAQPTPKGLAVMRTPLVDGIGVASYITTSVMNRWHQQHPDWIVIDDADAALSPRWAARAIQVPQMEIAGWSIGPVWFIERPDVAFHEQMSQYMDQRIDGAVGGNVFLPFVMTIDYPAGKAWFGCAGACEAKRDGR